MRQNVRSVDIADRLPAGYNFQVATHRVRSAFGLVVKDVESQAHQDGRQLTSADVNRLKDAVANLQPFLCSRMCLGFKGAVLKADNMHESEWPNLTAHRELCDDCGYLRYHKI